MTAVFLEINISQLREEIKRFAKLESRCVEIVLVQRWILGEGNQRGGTAKLRTLILHVDSSILF